MEHAEPPPLGGEALVVRALHRRRDGVDGFFGFGLDGLGGLLGHAVGVAVENDEIKIKTQGGVSNE